MKRNENIWTEREGRFTEEREREKKKSWKGRLLYKNEVMRTQSLRGMEKGMQKEEEEGKR